MTEKNSSKFIKTFRDAFLGLVTAFKQELNLRIHLLSTIIVVILGAVFRVSDYEWMLLVLVIGGVISMELVNSSIERLADLYSLENNPKIRDIKDLAAAAVIIMALVAVVVGIMIFLPKIVG